MISLKLLGPMQIFAADKQVTLTNAKAKALLAYLAVRQTPQTRSHILDLLWAASDEKSARKNLSNALWAIRKLMGEVVWGDQQNLALNDQVTVDTTHFESDLALYRGPFLDDLVLRDAPGFELWQTQIRAHFLRQYVEQVAEMGDSLRAQQRWRDLLTLTQPAVLRHAPLSEPIHRLHLHALIELDRRSEAHQLHAQFAQRMKNELGTNPSADFDRLLRESPSAKVSEPTKRPFVSREIELKHLQGSWERVRKGKAAAVAITGELGIGKTLLWQHWLQEEAPQGNVVSLRGLPETSSVPFAPLITAYRQLGWIEKIFGGDRRFPSALRQEIGRLAPDPERLEILPLLSAPAERGRVFEALLGGMLYFAPPPTILIADDVHWMDETTIAWLSYVMGALAKKPFLLLLTTRPEEKPPALAGVLARWQREQVAIQLTLDRFSLTEAAELGTILAVNQATLPDIHRLSSGNPYFLYELMQTGDSRDSLDQLLQARLGQLSDEAQKVVQACAILGNAADFETVHHVTRLPMEQMVDGLEELLTLNILQEERGAYQFVHPLQREVVQQKLSAPRQRLLHHAAAQAIVTHHADTLTMRAGQVAQHYFAGGNLPKAAHFADMATEHALLMTALEDARRFITLSLRADPTPQREQIQQQILALLAGG